jgi:hypothetical protein
VRIAPHFYNTEADIALLLDALPDWGMAKNSVKFPMMLPTY